MKPQFQHQIITSFALWIDYILLSKGQAYQNIDSSFYYQEDDRLDPDFVSFASPHKQWVTDSSIKGARVIEGIQVDGVYIPKNQKGIRYDYNNGRVLIPRYIASPNSNVEAIYCVKDFNIYITDQTEEELLIETKFDKNSRYDSDLFGGVKPYDQVVPAIFCSYEQGYNQGFAFGGEDITTSQIRCVVFAENSFQLDGVFSILKDVNNSVVSNVGFNEHPLNEFGDLKYGIYDYEDLADRYYNINNSQSVFHLDNIAVSKVNDKVAKTSHPGLYIGFIDFDIKSFRFPRGELHEPIPSRDPKMLMAPLSPNRLTLAPQKCFAPTELTLDPQSPFAPQKLQLSPADKPYPPQKLQLSPAGKPYEPYGLILNK